MEMNCDDTLKDRIAAHLNNFSRISPLRGGRAAAVAIPVVEAGFGADLAGMPTHASWRTDAALLLTRRSAKLRHHPGQWALPGGSVEPSESPEQAALREMHEEVGIDLEQGSILGRLDDFVTRSGFAITPIVVWVGPGIEPTPNPDEVESVHRIPVTELLREDAPMLNHDEGETEPVLRMPVGDSWIAAPTAALLYQFSQVCLLGHETRVAHYDQPKFAWR